MPTTNTPTMRGRTPHPDAALHEDARGRLLDMRAYRFDDPTVGVLETSLFDRRIAFETFRHLWRLTPEQRAAAMWRGDLTLAECLAWSGRFPDEVPLIGNEFAYIAMNTLEFQGEDED